MRRILTGLVLMALALPLGAQQKADKAATQAAGTTAAPSIEKVGTGDVLHVTVFGQPDMTTDGRISDRGTFSMPLVGEVKVAGASPTEAANRIAEALKKGQYLKNPQVAVAVTTARSRQVSVLGMVARPGRYLIEDPKGGIAEVIAAAGGITAGANETVTVIRDGEAQKVNTLGTGFELRPGDTIYIDRGPTFYIYGEVTRAGAYPVQPGLTVMQAISLSGGITPRGSERRLKMRRPGPDGQVVETDAKLQDQVKADDVIFVREALF
jgi:polysaccharide export outer membrane protein